MDGIAMSVKQVQRSVEIIDKLRGAQYHHHLIEAIYCYEKKLYLASCLCSITFIDITLRYLMAMFLSNEGDKCAAIDRGIFLSRDLLRGLHERGVDLSSLALEGDDFYQKIYSGKGIPKIISMRNDLCHGNYQNFFEDFEGEHIFTPEMVEPTAEQLIEIAETAWCDEFVRQKKVLGW